MFRHTYPFLLNSLNSEGLGVIAIVLGLICNQPVSHVIEDLLVSIFFVTYLSIVPTDLCQYLHIKHYFLFVKVLHTNSLLTLHLPRCIISKLLMIFFLTLRWNYAQNETKP